jgi:hypothetical protein
MENKIWTFADDKKNIKTPYEYLFDYASRLAYDTGNIVEGIVTESTSDAEEEVTYSLYLVVPKLRNYSYRLIEVIQLNAFTPYPVNMKLFGKAAGNVVTEKNLTVKTFEKKLVEFIKSPLTKLILTHLKTHLDIRNKFRVGEAKVATLKTGERINIGIVEIKGDEVLCLTGKGLRLMYKPGMNAKEQKAADELKKLSMEEKIRQQYMVWKKFDEFSDIF